MQNKNKHLTFEDRVMLEDLLNRCVTTFTTMAKVLHKTRPLFQKKCENTYYSPKLTKYWEQNYVLNVWIAK